MKILVIRNDKLGDFVQAFPAFAQLKAANPAIKLTALVPAYTAPLAQICPFLDDIIIDSKKDDKNDFKRLLKEIKQQKFDAMISFVSDVHNAKIALFAGIPYRLAPATKLIQFVYNQRLTQRRSRSEKAEFEYNQDLVSRFLKDHNIAPESHPQVPYLTFDNALLVEQKKKLVQQLKLDEQQKWIFVHSGSGGSATNLSLNQYAALIQGLLVEFNCQVVLTAGPNESAQAHQLAELINHENVRIYDKNEGLVDFAHSLACADLFIAGSTGPLHLSGALNIPTIGFYPSRRSALPIRWRPINDAEKHIAFCPPEGKETQMNLGLIDIPQALRQIIPFVRKMWQLAD
jgi:raw score 7.91